MRTEPLGKYFPESMAVERHSLTPKRSLDKLSLRAREAREKGLSYGQLMAAEYPTYQKPAETPKGIRKTCPYCGEVFYAQRSNKKFCSDFCRDHFCRPRKRSYFEQTNGKKKRKNYPVIGTCVETGEEVRYSCLREASENGWSYQAISQCLNGRQEMHRGYRWRRGGE